MRDISLTDSSMSCISITDTFFTLYGNGYSVTYTNYLANTKAISLSGNGIVYNITTNGGSVGLEHSGDVLEVHNSHVTNFSVSGVTTDAEISSFIGNTIVGRAPSDPEPDYGISHWYSSFMESTGESAFMSRNNISSVRIPIYVYYIRNASIVGNTINCNSPWCKGINVVTVNSLNIVKNVFVGENGNTVMDLRDMRNTTIAGNSMTIYFQYGLVLYDSGQILIEDNILTGGTTYDVIGLLGTGDKVEIIGNEIYTFSSYLIHCTQEEVPIIIKNNKLVSDTTYAAIALPEKGDVELIGNTIQGITEITAGNLLVSGNMIVDLWLPACSGDYSIMLVSFENGTFTNSILFIICI